MTLTTPRGDKVEWRPVALAVLQELSYSALERREAAIAVVVVTHGVLTHGEEAHLAKVVAEGRALRRHITNESYASRRYLDYLERRLALDLDTALRRMTLEDLQHITATLVAGEYDESPPGIDHLVRALRRLAAALTEGAMVSTAQKAGAILSLKVETLW